jgi:2-polyprenyl-6-methoxyphenol hydroxylase-like FAD-dependent oxidoreductase
VERNCCASSNFAPRGQFGVGEDGLVAVRSVLVVGAGIAGSTLAYFLARKGVEVTVVERASGQRSSGSPVDVRGPALAVVEQMNCLEPIRAAATKVNKLMAVDDHGGHIGWIPTQLSRNAIEISRSDLAALLASAARDDAEYLYDDTITALRETGAGIDVTFARTAPRRFDLVVGADGLHSTVRRLAFGPEELFVKHLGLYFATVALDLPAAETHTVLIHNAPGRAVVVHPTTGREGVGFFFRHEPISADDLRDPRARKDLVTDSYRGMGWRVPELLDRMQASDDVYFDSVSRVRLDGWSWGRTVLVGDAANSVSLFGEGSSMAICGAATLARAIAAEPSDVAAALRRYEQIHRRRIAPHHRGVSVAAHLLVPATNTELALRNALFRAFATAATLSSAVRRGGSRPR